jgi:hypothetical protein
MRQHLFVILFGLAAIAVGVYEYYDLATFEIQGGTRRVHTVIKLLYETMGKWGVLGFFSIVGTICLAYAGMKLARRPRDEQAA